ncbi:hypothetical protein BU17DRAFT_62990 [Hysterangium stoloniferum]|nr:hypothetical protein BU17DRAFT_62990 [Hysterangium stoloniferum]
MYKQERSKGEHEFVATEITRSATKVYCLVFDLSPGRDTFPVVDFSHILASVSAFQESYTLLGSSCYWFVGMVMKMVEDCFTVKRTRGNKDVSGKYRGVKIFHPDPDAMRDTMTSYNTRRSEEGRSLASVIEAISVNPEQRMASEVMSSFRKEGLLGVAGIDIAHSRASVSTSATAVHRVSV